MIKPGYITRMIRQAVLDLQQFIPQYRVGHTTKMQPTTDATATLTSTANVVAGDTVKIGVLTWTFVAALTGAEYEVLVGSNANVSLQNLGAAINGGPGAGNLYGTGDKSGKLPQMVPTWGGTVWGDASPGAAGSIGSAEVTAGPVNAGAFTVTAKAPGVNGNLIQVSTTSANLSWNSATLTGGGVDTGLFQTLGSATIGQLPTLAKLRDVWLVNRNPQTIFNSFASAPQVETFMPNTGVRYPVLTNWPWKHRFEMVHGTLALPDNNARMAIDPQNMTFMLYPVIQPGWELEIYWDGEKTEFCDTDDTPFDERAVLAAAEYVKGKIAREVDNDIRRYESHFDPRNGSYTMARRNCYLNAKARGEEQRD